MSLRNEQAMYTGLVPAVFRKHLRCRPRPLPGRRHERLPEQAGDAGRTVADRDGLDRSEQNPNRCNRPNGGTERLDSAANTGRLQLLQRSILVESGSAEKGLSSSEYLFVENARFQHRWRQQGTLPHKS